MRKISFPAWKESFKLTVKILFASLLAALVISGMDWIFSAAVRLFM